MIEWKPIDSAPKHKQILGSNRGRVYEMGWSIVEEAWVDEGERILQPIFWMEMPDPPRNSHCCVTGVYSCVSSGAPDGKFRLSYGPVYTYCDYCPWCGAKA